MAESFIEDLYLYTKVVSQLRQVVKYTRVADDMHAIDLLRTIIGDVQKFCEKCLEDHYMEAAELRDQLLQIPQIQADLVLLGDMLEGVAIPIMERWLQSLGQICQDLDEDYRVESTACGWMTLFHKGTGYYLHSNNDPMAEAACLVNDRYEVAKSSYIIWGCGLGYHIYQLYQRTQGAVPIRVYEPDKRVVDYATQYGVLSWIPEGVIELITDNCAKEFIRQTENKKNGILVHVPSMKTFTDATWRQSLEEAYIQYNAGYESKQEITFNFCRNKELQLPDISKLDTSNLKEEMVVIAAGPSFDHVVEQVRQWQGEKTLIAVGTIYRRLLAEGIRPDYVVVMDPYETTYKQFEGIEEREIPLLMNILSHWKIARNYQGPKYTMCVEWDGCGLMEYAKENEYPIWLSGGTVTALAIEFAIQYHAKAIYLAGVDLAYPAGVSHAMGTNQRSICSTDGMMEIRGVRGQKVYTDYLFSMYRQWLEARIANTKGIRFYNMSDVGAHIEGAMEWS